MTGYAAPYLHARSCAAVRLLALPMLGALLLSAPAKADEPAPPPLPVETVKGECSHPDESVTGWLQLIGDAIIGSYRCEAASLDWDNRLTFYRDEQATKVAIAFIGRREAEGGLTVTAVKRASSSETPATGRCRLIRPEGAGARRVLCYAKALDEPDTAELVEMVVTEVDWPGTAPIPGRCSAIGIAEFGLEAMIAQQTGEVPALLLQTLPACTAMTVVPGESFVFATTEAGAPITFLGSPDAERPALFMVTAVILPGGARHPVRHGGCLPLRVADGHVTVLCSAAYADGGDTRYVEVGFIPEASRFKWPGEEEEPEPAP